MSDFDAMTDPQINTAIDKILLSNAQPHWNGVKNYCNNPADAWPIITESRISIHSYKAQRGWQAFGQFDHVYADDLNPLRAAMVVFLKMKEAENDCI